MSTENHPQDAQTEDAPSPDAPAEDQAQAVAEAAEALAGAAGDDSLEPDSATDSGPNSELKNVAAERDQYRDAALRAQAELENYRKRVAREAETSAKFLTLPLVRDLLPALDNLGRTVQAAEQTGNVDDLIQGLQMIQGQFDQVFGNYSAKPIEALGQQFDPNLHEALQQMPSDEHPPMTVIQELERGYVMHDRVIRPSKVIVASAPAE
ncbi:MAG: nucleotide exchange factor GrpE [Planctomycetota bacterium]|jgi:molecular chaperone GrpE